MTIYFAEIFTNFEKNFIKYSESTARTFGGICRKSFKKNLRNFYKNFEENFRKFYSHSWRNSKFEKNLEHERSVTIFICVSKKFNDIFWRNFHKLPEKFLKKFGKNLFNFRRNTWKKFKNKVGKLL